MTRSEFDQMKLVKVCRHCDQLGVATQCCRNNNGLQIVCPNCGSTGPWGGGQFVSQENRKRRQPYPRCMSLDKVWSEYGDRCVSCGATKASLARLGIGLNRHHVSPYSQNGHRGRLVPVCTDCHQFINLLQKIRTRECAQ
jgi:hypothetical protein